MSITDKTPEQIREDQKRAGRTITMGENRTMHRPARPARHVRPAYNKSKSHGPKRDKVPGHEADLHRAVKSGADVTIEFSSGELISTKLTSFDSYTVTYIKDGCRHICFKQSIAMISIKVEA